MAKRYIRINWQNRPSVATSISATNLNKMDKGIDDIDNAIEEIYNKRVNNVVTTNPDTFLAGPVGKVLQDQITTLNNNLGDIKVPVRRQSLGRGSALTFNATSGIGIYLILTHQGGILTNLRSANLVFCAYEGSSGTVVPILASTDILITVSEMTITVKNNATAGLATVTLIQLS